MVTKKIGVIGCGNMGGAILYGALESGVLAKENVYVYDINPGFFIFFILLSLTRI